MNPNEPRKEIDDGELLKRHPEWCRVHDYQLAQLVEEVRRVRLAVCGDDALGVQGIVRDVAELKTWRKGVDLRVAGIAGAAGAAMGGAVKAILVLLKS